MRGVWLLAVFVTIMCLVSLTCEGVEVKSATKWHIMTVHKYPNGLQLRIITNRTINLRCIATNARGWPVVYADIVADKTISTHKLDTEDDLVYIIENVECYRTWEI